MKLKRLTDRGGLRGVVGLLFLVAGVAKAASFRAGGLEATMVWRTLGGDPLLVGALVTLEVMLGVALLAGLWPSAVARLAVGLILMMLLAVGAHEWLPASDVREPIRACGCFGGAGPADHGIWLVLARGSLMILALLPTARGQPDG